MAKAPTIDDLFPTGTPPEIEPTAAELEAASKPALFGFQSQQPAVSAPVAKGTIDDLFPTGGPPEPGMGEIATSIAKGTARGAARDAGIVPGAIAGFKLGMPLALKTAPVLGPFSAAIPLVTTAAGMYFGYEAGQAAESLMPKETDPRLFPYGSGGETFGSALVTAPAAFFLPVAGPTAPRIGTFISIIGESARRNPKAFLTLEGITAASMGVAGGAAEAYRPGQEGVRLGAELSVGVASSLGANKLLLTGIDLAKSGLSAIKSARGSMSAASEKKAADLLFKALETHGENPAELLKALRQRLPDSVPTPTAGQKTGSQALMDLEASLSNHRAEFGGETANQGKTAFLAYQALVEKLQEIGDPQSLRMVAELQQKRFDNIIATRLSLADSNAANKIAKITQDTPAARQQIGQLVKDETVKALAEVHGVESELWTAALRRLTQPVDAVDITKVPMQGVRAQEIFDRTGIWPKITIRQPFRKSPTLSPSATTEAFLERASQMGPALFDQIPPQVRKIMESFGVDEAAVAKFRQGKQTDEYFDTGIVPGKFAPQVSEQPVQDLVNYRSELLKLARDAAATPGGASKAGFLSKLADGMMRDLDTLQDPAYDQARQFSRSLNDVFTRTYAGSLDAVTKTGKDRVPPETLVNAAFSSGADQTALRMREIEDAVGFARTEYRKAVAQFGKDSPQAQQLLPLARAATGNVASVRDAHNRVLRLAAAEAIEVVPGREPGTFVQKLNFAKLTKFAQQNAPLLEKMGIMGDLRDAAQASNLLTQVANQNSVLNKTVKNQSAFAQLLTADNPSTVINESLTGRFPVKSINGLVTLAKKGGPNAVEGLKSSLYDYAYTKAGGNSGRFSPDAYEEALFSPLGRNQPSLVNIMRSNGLLTLQEVSNLKKLLAPMVRIETARKNNLPLEDVIQGADVVTQFGLRLAGSELGTGASKSMGGTGSSLIAATAGSQVVRKIFDALPNATVRAVLENAVKDPEVMALLLQKGRTEKEQRQIANKVINYLGSLGVSVGKNATTPALNYLDEDEPRPPLARPGAQAPFTVQGQAARQLRQLPVAPSTRGFPGMNANAATPRPAAPSSGPPTQANARAQYQALFPFDTVSPMVNNSNAPAQ